MAAFFFPLIDWGKNIKLTQTTHLNIRTHNPWQQNNWMVEGMLLLRMRVRWKAEQYWSHKQSHHANDANECVQRMRVRPFILTQRGDRDGWASWLGHSVNTWGKDFWNQSYQPNEWWVKTGNLLHKHSPSHISLKVTTLGRKTLPSAPTSEQAPICIDDDGYIAFT